MNKTFYIENLGCSKNLVDSEIMQGLLLREGYQVSPIEEAEIIIINTCGFIQASKEESLDTVFEMLEYKRTGACKKLIVAGCLTQRYAEELLAEIPEADGFLGTADYFRLKEMIAGLDKERLVYTENRDMLTPEELPRSLMTPEHYAYVKISEGCDNKCTYCIIPKIRGAFRSRKLEDIEREVKALVANGVKEVILIAQDTTQYGIDLYGSYQLDELLRRLSKIEDLAWIRIQYAYPDVIDTKLIDAMASLDKVVKYLDIPIQHASNPVLKRMNRHTTQERIREIVGELRSKIPSIRLRTTVIVGFPGETAEDFDSLLSFIEEIKFDRLGVFTYSKEENTPAALMPDQVEEEIKEQRYHQVMEKQMYISESLNAAMVGKRVDVIIDEEVPGEEIYVGRSDYDTPEVDGVVYVHGGYGLKIGDIVTVEVTDYMEYDLIGEVRDEFSK